MTESTGPASDRERHRRPAPARPEDIAVAVESRLRRSGYAALVDVSCESSGTTVRLRGHVPTYHLKQMAQAIALEFEGVQRVDNRIVVTADSDRPAIGSDRPATGTEMPTRGDLAPPESEWD